MVLRVGNPQCVVLGPRHRERLHAIAGPLAVHPFFPEGTNVELATSKQPNRVRILIWERGVGPTEASGTGACAAAVAAAAFGGAARAVDVISPGGTQRVDWTDDGIWLTGWAEVVGTVEWWGGLSQDLQRAGPARIAEICGLYPLVPGCWRRRRRQIPCELPRQSDSSERDDAAIVLLRQPCARFLQDLGGDRQRWRDALGGGAGRARRRRAGRRAAAVFGQGVAVQ